MPLAVSLLSSHAVFIDTVSDGCAPGDASLALTYRIITKPRDDCDGDVRGSPAVTVVESFDGGRFPTTVDAAVANDVALVRLKPDAHGLNVSMDVARVLRRRRAPFVLISFATAAFEGHEGYTGATAMVAALEELGEMGYDLFRAGAHGGTSDADQDAVEIVNSAVSGQRPKLLYESRLLVPTHAGLTAAVSALVDGAALNLFAVRASDIRFPMRSTIARPNDWFRIEDCAECYPKRGPRKRDFRTCKAHANGDKWEAACEVVPTKVMLVMGFDYDALDTAVEALGTWSQPMSSPDGKGACDADKGYAPAIDVLLIGHGSSTPEKQDALRKALGDARGCVNDVSISAMTLPAGWPMSCGAVLPQIEKFQTSHDYLVFVDQHTAALRGGWLDTLYEHVLLLPEHIWAEASLYRATAPGSAMPQGGIQPRSSPGIYRLGDSWFNRMAKKAEQECAQGSSVGLALDKQMLSDHGEFIKALNRWKTSKVILDTPPVFELADMDAFAAMYPDALLATQVMRGKRCLAPGGGCASGGSSSECPGCPGAKLWTPSGGPGSGYVSPGPHCPICQQHAALKTQAAMRRCGYDVGSGRVRCVFEQHKLAVVMTLNYKQIDETLDTVANYTMFDGYPCSHSKGFAPTRDFIFRYVGTDAGLDKNAINAKILDAMGNSKACFNSVKFQEVSHVPGFVDNYLWAPCAYFFGAIDLAHSYDYMLFMEPDVGVVRRGWADEYTERVYVQPEHIWQSTSNGKYNEKEPVPFDQHRNGVGLYRLGDPMYDHILSIGRDNCPGAFDRIMDHALLSDSAVFTAIWHNLAIEDAFLNCPPVFEYLDLDWFRETYQDTYIVHKMYRWKGWCYQQGRGDQCACFTGCPNFAAGKFR